MRIVAIGLGGAGSRIVDRLYATDRRSSKVACVQGIAIDVEEESLKGLGNLPDSAKLYYPPLDPHLQGDGRSETPTATIDISEIIAKIQNFESGETDAIFICSGLGGSLTDVAPHIISGLRSAIVEPIFGLVTLPCLAEGEKRSAKAADDIDILAPLLDGLILFDNETWYAKTAPLREKILNPEKGFVEKLGFGKQEPELSPQMVAYRLLNDTIVRRISLILRAGEFRADGGIDLAEVVLDSGEVLNTMKGMGFITIGYAVENIPSNPLGFLSQWKPKGIFDEENKKKASRIVDLAKQAIYNEISTPCDMTSAHKALILVAGPTHELSMKGFMTVRKWIDRSIAGLETRSGDYPVMNTKNIAIIIMLSGLENIPRVGELQEIREHYRFPSSRRAGGETAGSGPATSSSRYPEEISDEMIVLPPGMQRTKGEISPSQRMNSPKSPEPEERPPQKRPQIPVQDSVTGMSTAPRPVNPAGPKQNPAGHTVPSRNLAGERPERVVHPATPTRPTIPQKSQVPPKQRVSADSPLKPIKHTDPSPVERREITQPIDTDRTSIHPGASTPETSPKETPRQKIERELERQRIMTTPERIARSGHVMTAPRQTPTTIIKPREVVSQTPVGKTETPPGSPVSSPDTGNIPEKRTVIITRKKGIPPAPPVQETTPVPKQEKYIPTDEPVPEDTIPEKPGSGTRPDQSAIALKDPAFRVKDRIFEGKTVQKGFVPLPRDSALLKANLHLGRKTQRDTDPEQKTGREESVQDDDTAEKKQDKSMKKKDDISWI